jgi:hypothetical protein
MSAHTVVLPIGTRVKVWPGTLEGRSYAATTLSEPRVMGDTEGVYVRSDTGGTDFIALTHVKKEGDDE